MAKCRRIMTEEAIIDLSVDSQTSSAILAVRGANLSLTTYAEVSKGCMKKLQMPKYIDEIYPLMRRLWRRAACIPMLISLWIGSRSA